MAAKSGLSVSALAKAADLAPSTLNRFMKGPVKHILSLRTLSKLSEVSGIHVPQDLARSIAAAESDPFQSELLAVIEGLDDAQKQAVLVVARTFAKSDRASEMPAARIDDSRYRRAG